MRYKPKVANRKAHSEQFTGRKFVVCFSAETDVLLYAFKNRLSPYPTQYSRQRIPPFLFTGLMRRIWLFTLSVSKLRMLRVVAVFPRFLQHVLHYLGLGYTTPINCTTPHDTLDFVIHTQLSFIKLFTKSCFNLLRT
jgi:hypothetical protein